MGKTNNRENHIQISEKWFGGWWFHCAANERIWAKLRKVDENFELTPDHRVIYYFISFLCWVTVFYLLIIAKTSVKFILEILLHYSTSQLELGLPLFNVVFFEMLKDPYKELHETFRRNFCRIPRINSRNISLRNNRRAPRRTFLEGTFRGNVVLSEILEKDE